MPTMRPRWRGMLQLGLVSVPVHLYATADKKSPVPTRHNIHRKCKTQLESQKHCPLCNVDVAEDTIEEFEEIIEVDGTPTPTMVKKSAIMKGCDVPGAKGAFVEITDEELDGLKVESTKTIQITRIAEAEELEPLMIADTSYLMGDGTAAAAEAEALLLAALDGKVAVGTLCASKRERVVAVQVYRGGFVLHVLRMADALKRDLPARPPLPAPDPEMLKLARQLVKTLEGPLELDDTRDAYADGVKALVAVKASGVAVPANVPLVEAVPQAADLKAALLASVAAAKPKPAKAELKAAAPKLKKSA